MASKVLSRIAEPLLYDRIDLHDGHRVKSAMLSTALFA